MILKQKLKFGMLMAWVTLLFVACEYDEKTIDYHTQDHAEKHLKVSKVNFNQLQNNKKLMDRLGKLKNTTQQTAARIIQSNDNSFYIDTDFAYLIESENGKHSYTFQIIRQNPQYHLENLILKKNNTDGYNLFIAQYDITESEYEQLQNGENPSLINKLNIVPVANNIINTTTILNRGSAEGMCLTETIIPATSCSCEGHTITDLQNGEFCTCSDSESIFPEQTIYSWEPCGDDGGGGGGDPIDDGNYDGPGGGYPGGSGDGTPPNGDSGNSNPNNPPDNTDPNPDNSFEDTEDPVNTTPVVKPVTKNNPCDEIKKVIEKPQFSTNMQVLKNNINGTKEKGFIIRDKEGTDAFSQIAEGDNDGNVTYPYGDSTPAELDNLWKSIGTAHNHLNSQIGIFSPEDLENLFFNGIIETNDANPYKNTIPKKSVIFVITDKGLFALKINDFTKLKAFCEDYGTWSLLTKEAYLHGTFNNPKLYNITPNSTHDQQITGFLRFIQDQDIGVDLYEGNEETFSGWKKLNLTENNGSYSFTESLPCNN